MSKINNRKVNRQIVTCHRNIHLLSQQMGTNRKPVCFMLRECALSRCASGWEKGIPLDDPSPRPVFTLETFSQSFRNRSSFNGLSKPTPDRLQVPEIIRERRKLSRFCLYFNFPVMAKKLRWDNKAPTNGTKRIPNFSMMSCQIDWPTATEIHQQIPITCQGLSFQPL